MRLNKTQEEFAKILGVSRNYVSLLEIGRKPMTRKIQAKMTAIEAAGVGAVCENVGTGGVDYAKKTVNESERYEKGITGEVALLQDEVRWLREIVKRQQDILEKALDTFERSKKG